MSGQIWCVGRNYAEHAKELGNDLPSEPLFFLKAAACQTRGHQLQIPAWVSEVHHELEIAFRFDDNLELTQAALALDLTERELQNRLKSKGQPWTLAKSFIGSCPVSEWKDLPALWNKLEIRLWINGELRQHGHSGQMIFSPETLRQFALRHFPVQAGDLLLTGTPAGVGPIASGDQLVGELELDGQPWLRVEWHRP